MTSAKYFDAISLVVTRGHSYVLLDTIKIYGLQSTLFTHERSFNEDCIFHVRIPFFNSVNVFLQIDWKITIFFRWTKSILQKVTRNIRNRLHGAAGRSANQLPQGCHPLSRILLNLHKKTGKWLSRRVDWIVSDDFMNSSFWHPRVPWNIWQPQSSIEKVNDFVPCIKRLKGKGLLVPCIRGQRFTRSLD